MAKILMNEQREGKTETKKKRDRERDRPTERQRGREGEVRALMYKLIKLYH